MNTSISSSRVRAAKVVAVCVAGATVGLIGAVAVDAARSSNEPAYMRAPSPDLVDYARTNGLSGLSPESLQPVVTTAGADPVADYARSNGLTGLSPESLQPVVTTAP